LERKTIRLPIGALGELFRGKVAVKLREGFIVEKLDPVG